MGELTAQIVISCPPCCISKAQGTRDVSFFVIFNLDDVMMITDEDIVNALDGLPEFKIHCSALGATGLQKAIMDYFEKYVSRTKKV